MPGCLRETVSVTGWLYSVAEEQREEGYDPDDVLHSLTSWFIQQARSDKAPYSPGSSGFPILGISYHQAEMAPASVA